MLNRQFFLIAWLLGLANHVYSEEDLSCDDIIETVYNQSDIDFYSTCPKLNDLFFIDHSFTGPFVLPEVKTLGSFSAGYYAPKLSGQTIVEDGVTSVSMPDLENTTYRGMLFGYINNLTDLSFPKLNLIIGDLVIVGDNKIKKVEFPALSNVTGGSLLWGDFDEIHLPALKTIGYLQVQSTGNLDCRALGANLSSLTFTPKQFDVGVGFTCWTPYESNRYNSSDRTQSSTSAGSSSASLTGASPTTSTKSSGVGSMRHLDALTAALCSIALAVFGFL